MRGRSDPRAVRGAAAQARCARAGLAFSAFATSACWDGCPIGGGCRGQQQWTLCYSVPRVVSVSQRLTGRPIPSSDPLDAVRRVPPRWGRTPTTFGERPPRRGSKTAWGHIADPVKWTSAHATSLRHSRPPMSTGRIRHQDRTSGLGRSAIRSTLIPGRAPERGLLDGAERPISPAAKTFIGALVQSPIIGG